MENNETPQKIKKSYALPLGSKAGGLSYSALVILNLLVSLVASFIIVFCSLQKTEIENYISLLISPVAVAIILTLALTVTKQPAKSLLPLKTSPKYYLIALLIVFGALFSLSWINDGIVELLELIGYTRRDGFIPDVTGWKIIPALIVVAVIPAVMEEIMFRGILLNNIEGEVGSINAVFISGFCFSLYHGSVEQTVYQFIVGCLFGLIAVRSRSIAPTVIIHFINNALIIILLACGLYDEAGTLIISSGGQIALYVLSAASLVGGVIWLILDKTELKKPVRGSVKKFFLFAAAGIAVMALMWIIGLF